MCSNQSKVCNVGMIDFVVIKINGNDVNQMSRCEAVQTFLSNETETIMVELCRRNITTTTTAANGCGNGDNPEDLEQLIILTEAETNDNSSQFKRSSRASASSSPDVITCDNELILTLQEANAGTLAKSIQSKQTQTECKSFDILAHQQRQQHIIAREMTERFIEQEHNIFEQCLEPEIDIEEVTLSKSVGSKQPLGLTICYNSGGGGGVGTCSNSGSGSSGAVARAFSSSDDNETTEVFISDIQSDSLAARDGRLRRGDQILQINGKDIKGKHDTERIIMENNNSVTLLVSRYLYGEDAECSDDEDEDEEEEYYVENNLDYANGFLINDYTNVVDKLDKVLLRQVHDSVSHVDGRREQSTLVENSNVTRNVEQLILADINTTDCMEEEAVKGSTSTRTKATITDPVINLKQQQLQKGGAITKTMKTDEQQEHTHLMLLLAQAEEEEILLKTTVPSSLAKSNNSQTTTTTTMLRKSNQTQMLNAKKQDYDENEHIYETIPEDSESEPFYCSPYQSSTYMTAGGSCSSATAAATATTTTEVNELQQQKQRVAQWLGIKPTISSTIMAAAGPRTNSRTTLQRSVAGRNGSGTLRSAITNTTSGSSSSGGGGQQQQNLDVSSCNPIENELENSSSAYNTGGSNNSVSPLALALTKQQQQHGLQENEFNLNTKVRATLGSKTQRLPSPKTEQNITSPKTNLLLFGKQFMSTDNHFRNTTTVDDQQLLSKTLFRNGQPQQPQHCYRNTLQQQHQQYKHFERQQQQAPSSQFNAPNLSQYHFVSSQEVTTAANLNPSSSPKINVINARPSAAAGAAAVPPPVQKSVSDNLAETTPPMVWKVKRRPDGTRYIVRRPVRNRLPSSVRRNVRNNDVTTTEDDTISEVKIGRYWTKEERKRHIERAKERRNHQQQQQQQQQL